jgi:hypothetical protein
MICNNCQGEGKVEVVSVGVDGEPTYRNSVCPECDGSGEDTPTLLDGCEHVCSGNCRRVGCNCKCGEFHMKKDSLFDTFDSIITNGLRLDSNFDKNI